MNTGRPIDKISAGTAKFSSIATISSKGTSRARTAPMAPRLLKN